MLVCGKESFIFSSCIFHNSQRSIQNVQVLLPLPLHTPLNPFPHLLVLSIIKTQSRITPGHHGVNKPIVSFHWSPLLVLNNTPVGQYAFKLTASHGSMFGCIDRP